MFIENPQINIIGAGKIAYSLLPALRSSGYTISSVISKNLKSAGELAYQNSIPNFSDSLDSLSPNSNLIFLSVPDGEIENVANRLSTKNLDFKNLLFVHLSGALDISVLNKLQNKGAYTAAFHIMQTFPSKKDFDISDSYVSIETDDSDVKDFLFILAKNLKLKPFEIETKNKGLYHLAGVFASNFMVGNLYDSKILFDESNKSEINFFEVLEPIISATLENIKKSSVKNSLSGPIQRGDIKTIENHLNSLKKLNDKSLTLNYISQSLNLFQLINDKDLTEEHRQIKNLLQNELENLSA